MNIWEYLTNSPWWALIYIFLICATSVACYSKK